MKPKLMKKILLHIVGGIVFLAAMCVIIPKFMDKYSNYLFRKSLSAAEPQDDDDWGPEIVKESSSEDTKENTKDDKN